MGNKIARHRRTVDERYTRPQGLYQHKDVDHRKLRRLILDAKLAPCYPGADDLASDLEECPICFLFYPSLNRSKCCTKGICTECFLQLKSPHAARTTQCPFCKYPNYAVEYRGAKTLEEKGFEQAEEQKVIEAKMRMRQKELEDEKERMLRKEDDIQEGRIFPSSELLRNSFSNLHGFTAPLSDGVDRGHRAGGIVEGLSYRQPEADQLARSMVEENSNSTLVESQQSSLQSSSAIPSVPERNFSTTALLLGSADGNSMLGQAARVQGSFMRFNRGEEFDLDLEDIMVMEAVWRSIQDQPGSQQSPTVQGSVEPLQHSEHARSRINTLSSLEDGQNAAHPPASGTGDMREVVIRSSVTGGLAGAIAALAERQVLNVDNSASQQIQRSHQVGSEIEENSNMGSNSTGNMNGVCRVRHDLQEGDFSETVSAHGTPPRSNGTQLYRDADLERVRRCSMSRKRVVQEEVREQSTWMDSRDNISDDSQCEDQSLNNWIEVSLENGRVLSPHVSEDGRGSISDWMLDHSSEAVEVGTSFSSSVPSASELPWEAPDVPLIQNSEGATDSEGFTVSSAMVPESYEEQMMLAMALSLAEAQARFR